MDTPITPNVQTNTHEESETLNESHHNHMGPVLGGMLIILVLILGGLYLWGSTLVDDTANQAKIVSERVIPNNEPETPRAKADARIMETTSPSDELDAIEADLMSTNLDSLDVELNQAEREIDTALNGQ